MARVKLEDNHLVISIKGVRQFWASPALFKLVSELSIPLENVTGVSVGIEWKDVPVLGEKKAGTDAGFYYGGVFIQEGKKVFYDIKRKEEALVIMTKDEDYERIVIGVDDPTVIVEQIEKALASRN